MKKPLVVIIVIVAVIACCVILAISERGSQNPYDACVHRCINEASDANIHRDDITNAQFSAFMRAQKAVVCPNKCKHLK